MRTAYDLGSIIANRESNVKKAFSRAEPQRVERRELGTSPRVSKGEIPNGTSLAREQGRMLCIMKGLAAVADRIASSLWSILAWLRVLTLYVFALADARAWAWVAGLILAFQISTSERTQSLTLPVLTTDHRQSDNWT